MTIPCALLTACALLAAAADSQPAASASAPHLAPAPPSRPRVLVLDLQAGAADAETAKVLGGLVTSAVAQYPSLEAISTADIRQMVDLELQKQQAGCDSASCLAEVAGALGAQYIVFGNVGHIDELTVVSLSLFDAARARAVARQSLKARSRSQLAVQIDSAVAALVDPLVPEADRTAAAARRAREQVVVDTGARVAGSKGVDLTWLAWAGGITTLLSGLTFVGMYTATLFMAREQGAPLSVVRAMIVPVWGMLEVAQDIGPNNDANLRYSLYGFAGLQAALLAVTGVGGIALAIGRAVREPGLTWVGQVWQWGLLAASTTLVVAGVIIDTQPASAHNLRFEALDVVPVGLYAMGGITALAALFLNPFVQPAGEAP